MSPSQQLDRTHFYHECLECRGNPRYQDWELYWKTSLQTDGTTTCSQRQHHTCRVFRCAGIYGADRSAVYKQGLLPSPPLHEDRSIDDRTSITSRIHASDIAAAIRSSMGKHRDHDASSSAANCDNSNGNKTNISDFCIYNLADDCPENRQTVLEYAAGLLETVVGVHVLGDNEDTGKNKRER